MKKKVHFWLKSLINDNFVKIILKNSSLTKIQLETLLIDILSEKISGKRLKYEEKAFFRLRPDKISRGSFNRTLKQAKKNVTSAIYTIILLGYLGLFESVELEPFIEVGSKLQKYLQSYRKTYNKEVGEEHLLIMDSIKQELQVSLKELCNF